MGEPNAFQQVAINSLKNGIPSGTRLKAFAYAPTFGVKDRQPDITVARTTTKEGEEVVEHFNVTPDGKVEKTG
jgi:hypothetical protein